MKKLILSISLLTLGLNSNAQIWSVYETINFETPDSLLQIDTSIVGNSWQVGTPSKLFFDSAYSAPNAIVTDTMSFYPPNNLSAFTIKISDPAWNPQFQLNRTFINITHKFDTDSLNDGGYIEISYDAGATWTNIANDPNNGSFYYEPNSGANPIIANGNAAFTGKSNGISNGWRQDGFGWCYFPDMSNPQIIYMRFVFSSDSIQTNKEGWMIDNILLMTDICEGISEIHNDNLISISPNPTSNELKIHRTNGLGIPKIQIFNYTGQEVYSNNSFTAETIDTRNLTNGIYLLKYSEFKHFAVKRFIVKH